MMKKILKWVKWVGIVPGVILGVILLSFITVFALITVLEIHRSLSLQMTTMTSVIYGFFILMPVCAIGFMWWAYRRRNPTKTSMFTSVVGVLNKGAGKLPSDMLPITFQIAFLLLFTIYFFNRYWPEWWWNKTLSIWTIFVVVGLVIFAATKKKGTKSFKYSLASVILSLTIVVLIVHFLVSPIVSWAGNDVETAKSANAGTTSDTSGLPFLLPNPEVEKVVRKFWSEDKLMAEICGRESKFNQFEADGTTPYRGRANSQDVGVCQINEGWWLAKSQSLGPEYSLYTLDGNLKMSRWIRERYGADEWNTYDEATRIANRGGMTFVVPADGSWSEVVDTSTRNCHFHPDGDFFVRDSYGGEHEMEEPNKKRPRLVTKTIQYRKKIAGDTPEMVTVTCD